MGYLLMKAFILKMPRQTHYSTVIMTAIKLELIPHKTLNGLSYQHLRITLTSPEGVIEPKDLQGLQLPPQLQSTQGVVLEGKAPIWLYAYLTHECHATAWVGCFDPRLGGAVVVETHSRDVRIGQVLPLELPETKENGKGGFQ